MICAKCREGEHDLCDDKVVAVPLPAVTDLLKTTGAIRTPCPHPQIGKPPHCGREGCGHLHGDEVEQKAVKYEPREGRLYRSCVCQHKVRVGPEESRLPG